MLRNCERVCMNDKESYTLGCEKKVRRVFEGGEERP